MRIAPYLVAVFLIAAAVSVSAQMKTAFTIPLPSGPSTSEFYMAGAGDMYYTVGTLGRIYAVNLTEKKIQYTQRFEGAQDINGFIALEGGILLVYSDNREDVVALGPHGQLLWVGGDIDLSTRKNGYTVSGGKLFIASDTYGTFTVIDLMTGKTVGTPIDISAGSVFPTEAILTVEGASGNNEILCYEIPSLKKKWGIQADNFLIQTKDYLLVSRPDPQTQITEVLVLNPKTIGLISTLKNTNNINGNDDYAIVNGDHLLAEIGFNSNVAYFDLKNGTMLWTYSPSSGSGNPGGGFLATDYSVVFIAHTKMHFINITDGTALFVVNGVPYTASHTITPFDDGKFLQVTNLQGYTTWNAKTGKYVGRNEMDPSSATNSNGLPTVYQWGKYTVSTIGNKVVAKEMD